MTRHFEDARRAGGDDLAVLAEEVFELDVPVEPPAAHEEFMQALDAFNAAERQLDAARHAEDLEQVSATIGEGRYRMACVLALRAGRPLPRHMPPCFFDPRHGTASELMAWTPVLLDPRTVPVCVADGRLVERDLQPKPRLVVLERREIVFWDAPGDFAGWFRGYFSVGDICDPAKLLDGTRLGEALSESG